MKKVQVIAADLSNFTAHPLRNTDLDPRPVINRWNSTLRDVQLS